MTLRPPTQDEIRELGSELDLNLSDEEVQQYRELVRETLGSYEIVRSYGEVSRKLSGRQRDPGYRVGSDDDSDPYNAWITRCSVEGNDSGPLEGWDVAVKDNIAVGGVEMTCGSQVLEGYVPKKDATVVSRLLEAGASIVGKTNLDDMAFTGNGHSSAFGPMLNPHDEDRLSGGSSGGSAIAVQQGEVDGALGGDQGGSIRVPAAWTGVVGHKPTHGLVPYTGAVGIENTIDHIGPITSSVNAAARMLSVISGRDSNDPRQPRSVPTEQYENNLNVDLENLEVARIEEGFDRPESDTEVNEKVDEALDVLESEGATVDSVSIPLHEDAQDIYTVALAEGFLASVRGEGAGHNWKGEYNVQWIDVFGKSRRSQGGGFPPSVKLTLLLGAYTSEEYHSKYYAKAMNLRQRLTEAYEDVLDQYDVVAMPTTPQRPHEYKPDMDIFEWIGDAWTSLANTSTFNMTGHPSLSVPVNFADGLPVGIMITGKRFDDGTVLGVGSEIESRLK